MSESSAQVVRPALPRRTFEQSTVGHYVFLIVLIVIGILASIAVWPVITAVENATGGSGAVWREAALWTIIIGWFVALIVLTLAFVYPWPRKRRMERARKNFDAVTPVVDDCAQAGRGLVDDGAWGTRAAAVAAQLRGRYDAAGALLSRIDSRGFVRAGAFNLWVASDIDEFEKEANEFLAPAAQLLGRLPVLYARQPGWESVLAEEVAATRGALDASFREIPIDRLVPADELDYLRDLVNWGNEYLDEISEDGERLLPPAGSEQVPGIAAEVLNRIADIRGEVSAQMAVLYEKTDFPGRDTSYDDTFRKMMEKTRRAENFAQASILSFFDPETFYAPPTYERGYIVGFNEVRWSKVGDAMNNISSAERRLR